jgi:sigma-B regulation protein RsbU (phosphoserine phosphatase)
MEMMQAKDRERSILLVEMIAIWLICILALVAVYNGQHHVGNYLDEVGLQVGYRLANIAVLVAIFVLFNTTYYSFVSYRSKRMLVLSTVSAGYAVSYTFYFVTSFMTVGYLESFNPSKVSLELAIVNLMLLVGLSLAHVFDEADTFKPSGKFRRMLPLIYGMAGTFFNISVVSLMVIRFSQMTLDTIAWSMNWLGIFTCLVIIYAELRRFIKSQRRYVIRMASSISLLLVAFAIRLFPDTSFFYTKIASNLFLILSIFSYTYSAFKYNINMPLIQQRNAERQITLYAENLEKIVQKRTSDLRRNNELFIRDIDYAKRIQQSLLPGTHIKFNGAEFVASYFPCERLSGDFYDIFMIDRETVGMYVLDVSGHGIPAALMTMFCMNYIKSSERLINQYRAKKPHRNLKHFFEEFNKVNFPDEMHMVMFIASYDLHLQQLTYCSGGMNTLPFVMRTDGTIEKLDQSKGFPICRVGNFFTPEFHSAKIQLNTGDRVLFYTDGLTDKGKNQVYDEKALLEILQNNRDKSIDLVRERIVSGFSRVVNRLDDDVTFFIMEVN